MKQTLLLFLLLFSGLLQQAWAQDRTISGKVIDRATNQGLPGVTVIVKDKGTIGTSTNSEGVYTLPVPAGTTTLVFSFVGYATQEAAVTGSNTVNISLATDAKQLNEVVVTALNVERTRNSLAYSATQIDGNAITVARNPNALNGLSGKVAGLNIQQNNSIGGSTNVVIRGTKSLFGNNQALFVVDGVPISNQNTNSAAQQSGQSGYDFGNAAADINPDDIASTTVLKGAAASALYGERAANGVVLITTKKGRRGTNVTVNSGLTVGRIDKSTFIKYQKEYGGGYGPYYDDPTGYFNLDPSNNLVVPTSEDAAYGARFDPTLNVLQWGAYTPGSATFGQATPWVAAQNDPSTFFKTAVSTLNSVIVDGGGDQGTFKLGYTNNVERGTLPNSQINKDIVNLGASLNITPKLTLSSNVNFSRTSGLGRYGTGYGSENLMTNFRQWWQPNVDIKELKSAYEYAQQNATWNLRSPQNGDNSAIYWNNPYFVRYQNYENDTRYRTFGNVVATYKVADWFNVLGRVTLDSYDEVQEERSAVGSTAASYPSYYSRFNHTYREANFDLIGNFNKNFTENFSLRGLIGVNLRRQYDQSIFATTNGGLALPGLYDLANTISPIVAPVETNTRVAVDGIFANATLGYRDRLFLDLTLRRDVSTTLPAGLAYYYPSAALGYVFSESLQETLPWLSYGKARVNYAEVGSGTDPLRLFNSYRQQPALGAASIANLPLTRNNADLVPERTRSVEAGVELAFLQNRLGLEATAYQQNTRNQIIPLRISTATGYQARIVNSGEVQNRGLELTAFFVPVKTQNVNWRISANWANNRNKVLSLFNNVDNIVLTTYQGDVSSNATVGQPFGTLRGTNYTYLNGQRIVGADGEYVTTDGNQVIGNPNPKWRGGVTNTVSYKNLSLTFLIDVRSGGQVFSLDRYYGLSEGLQPETAGLNDLGNPSRLPIAQGGGIIRPGVLADGSPNTTRIENVESGPYGYGGSVLGLPNAGFVYDASFVKLREVSLSIALPKELMTRLGFIKGADISVVGRNLWLIHKNLPDADPEEGNGSGNLGLGYQGGAYPTTRTLGANLRLSF
jgi:TonB-linked SusC/RagA family outer membrane protein